MLVIARAHGFKPALQRIFTILGYFLFSSRRASFILLLLGRNNKIQPSSVAFALAGDYSIWSPLFNL